MVYFKQIKLYCDLLDVPGRVVETAKTVMYQFEEARGDLKRYLPVQSGALAAIHVGCLEAQSGRTMSDLVADLRIAGCSHETGLPSEKELWQTRKKILKQLPAWSRQNDAGDIIQQVCTTMELPHEVCRVAMHMHERIQPLVEGMSLFFFGALRRLFVSGAQCCKHSRKRSSHLSVGVAGRHHLPVVAERAVGPIVQGVVVTFARK